ncbi:flagellar biosynthesis anti-sigma factor FlgM [Proteiniclasticum sp. C24MP]|uniref:flagellar biosynthesis anti-sigma factor FlgM n=1 Tax=Proteiniclasticum sp. C24MP TaxID=3374101 RepID=UPI0037542495
MKIDQFHTGYVKSAYKTSDERKNGHVDGKTIGKSTVEISTQAKALVKKINESEDSHFSEKVESIRRSIQEGSYKVDTDQIADKILEKIEEQK